MTLVATSVRPDGIVMIADSFLSSRGQPLQERPLKIIRLDKFKGGISVWGKHKPFTLSDGRTPTFARFLMDFIQQDDSRNFRSFCQNLRNYMNSQQKNGDAQAMGCHVCGYMELEGEEYPCFFHIHNKKKNDYFDDELLDTFVLGEDYPPENKGQRMGITHNGDYIAFNAFIGSAGCLVGMVNHTVGFFNKHYCDATKHPDRKIILLLDESLEGHKNSLILLLRLVAGIYQISNYPQIIGGETPFLILPKEGGVTYEKCELSPD